MNRVTVAVATELLDFESSGGIATVFAGGVTGHTLGTFVGIRATFGAFDGDRNADAFFACHIFTWSAV